MSTHRATQAPLVIAKVSGQQWATSSYVWGDSEVIHGFLAVWVVGTPNSCVVQGYINI